MLVSWSKFQQNSNDWIIQKISSDPSRGKLEINNKNTILNV